MIKKAFDAVSHERLHIKLELYGIKGIVLELLKSHHMGKQQIGNANEAFSSLKPISIGVPQF